MTLFEQWRDLIDNQKEETFEEFWGKYSGAETRIYSAILKEKNPRVQGVFKELAETYDAEPVLFMGFLDGINSSLRSELPIEGYDETSNIDLDIDFEALFFNMLGANADYLFTLDEWDAILSEEKRQEIATAFKRSRTVVKEQLPGRNDPCPCGSGKKYKKCCGAN